MIGLKRFQEILRTITCQSTPGMELKATVSSSSIHKAAELSQNLDVNQNSNTMRSINQVTVESNNDNTMRKNYREHEVISIPVMSSYSNNANKKPKQITSIRSPNYTSYNKSQTQKSSDIKYTKTINKSMTRERSFKYSNRDIAVKAPPPKDNNKFSRYKPLPAINSGENLSAESREHLKNRKLVRQLTYKVINPLFVKGPIDLPSVNNPSNLPKNCLQSSRSRPSTSCHVKRSKTIVIKSQKPDGPKSRITATAQNQFLKNSKPHMVSKSSLMNVKKSSINPNEKGDNTTPAITNEDPDQECSKIAHARRPVVRKDLIEAAKKVRDSKKPTENEFWVEF